MQMQLISKHMRVARTKSVSPSTTVKSEQATSQTLQHISGTSPLQLALFC